MNTRLSKIETILKDLLGSERGAMYAWLRTEGLEMHSIGYSWTEIEQALEDKLELGFDAIPDYFLDQLQKHNRTNRTRTYA